MKLVVTSGIWLRIAISGILNYLLFLTLLPLIILLYCLKNIGISSHSESSALLALFPGECGHLIRRLWYKMTLTRCGKNLRVGWMAIIRNAEAEIGNNVSIGPFCYVCRARIGDDTMLASHSRVLSGMQQHHTQHLDIPIRQQGGIFTTISVGNDCWIGDAVIVMADVASGSVIAAGSVVNKTFPPFAKLGGVPARMIGQRGDDSNSHSR